MVNGAKSEANQSNGENRLFEVMNDFEKGMTGARQAHKAGERSTEEAADSMVSVAVNSVRAITALGRTDIGLSWYQNALSLINGLGQEMRSSQQYMEVHCQYAYLLLSVGRLDEAHTEFHDIMVVTGPPVEGSPAHMTCLEGMARLNTSHGQLDKGLKEWQQLSEILKKNGSNKPKLMETMREIGALLNRLERFGEAVDVLTALENMQHEVFGENHADCLRTRKAVAAVRSAEGRAADAVDILEKVSAIELEVQGPSGTDYLETMAILDSLQTKTEE